MTDRIDTARTYATEIVRALGFGHGDPLPLDMIDRAMGLDALHLVERLPPVRQDADAVYFRLGDRWRIAVRRDLPDNRTHWALTLAFARWCLDRDGVRGVEARQLRAPLASALLLPADVVGPHLRDDPRLIAHRLVVPVMASLLRRAELERIPTLVVARGRWARVRGDATGALPRDVATAERWVFGPRVLRTRRWAAPGETERAIEWAA